MKLKFCGAARTVTGSCHMLSCDSGNILVDCGMRQGADAKLAYGEDGFPFDPAKINAVLLTHAHIDHSGLLPLLVKRGFTGSIFTTKATAQLASIMLPDSGHIQQQEAEYQNRKNERSGKPFVEPLYDVNDANECLKHFVPASYDENVQILPGVVANFRDAGHLLGSAAIEVFVTEGKKTVKTVFSGDIGRDNRPIIRDPESIESADYLVMEGTYGDRNHDASSAQEKETQFANVLRRALVRGGNIVIPTFAVGRTQELLYYIHLMLINGTVPGLEKVPVYIDSPLGINATRIYEKCAEGYYDDDAKKMAQRGSPFEFPTLRIAQTADESKLINEQRGSNIIISSSGMCDAGRIRHHLKHNLYRADSTVIFVGYQAEGTLGRILLNGVKKVKLFGEDVRVNATIERIDGFSGHAGRDELIEWLCDIKKKPTTVFLVHGEEDVLESLGAAVHSLGYAVEIPEADDEFDLAANKRSTVAKPEVKVKGDDLKAAAKRITEQAQRITDMLNDLPNDEDTRLKLKLMEKDVKQFVERWQEFLK